MAGGSPEDVWLQPPLLLLPQLDFGVLLQPGLMRQALALCMGLQQRVSLVSHKARCRGGGAK